MIDKNEFDQKFSDERGQTFLEFLLLIAIMITLSYIMIRGVNGQVAERWTILIKIIAAPTSSNIQVL